jgi:hypothetical protein
MNPFDFVKSITFDKKDLMKEDEGAEKSYSSFLTNRSLSYHTDTLFYAQEMNVHHNLDNKLQYRYLLNTIRPKKRFAKWSKKKQNSNIGAVMEYYGYGYQKAISAISILSDDQLDQIKTRIEKGG